ncbi:zinc finger MYM-type protein 1-like [Aphis craccivora]|uniref:Zinc finger MYM-type protein 1-like n=1 Tax=Aphis craccivora TaxID=307492 RepID=A0A6G0VZB1_APHCR|nr:zinc finger MYM-type protein 1-like [Aphis craccivora]
MKIETFLVIIDTIVFQLNKRMEVYIEINNRFGFLLNLENETLESVRIQGKNLVELYHLDLETDFEEELIQFKSIVKDFPTEC